jgi:MFS family permease
MDGTRAANTVRNAPLLVVSSGLRAALFPIPVITLFWKDEIGITLSGIMWLQAIFAAAAVLVEFPSGYVADRLGYRFSMLSGTLLCVGGWLAYAVGTTFVGMAIAEILLGMGLAFISGADSALLFASVQKTDDLAPYRRWRDACAPQPRQVKRSRRPRVDGCTASRRGYLFGCRFRWRSRTPR